MAPALGGPICRATQTDDSLSSIPSGLSDIDTDHDGQISRAELKSASRSVRFLKRRHLMEMCFFILLLFGMIGTICAAIQLSKDMRVDDDGDLTDLEGNRLSTLAEGDKIDGVHQRAGDIATSNPGERRLENVALEVVDDAFSIPRTTVNSIRTRYRNGEIGWKVTIDNRALLVEIQGTGSDQGVGPVKAWGVVNDCPATGGVLDWSVSCTAADDRLCNIGLPQWLSRNRRLADQDGRHDAGMQMSSLLRRKGLTSTADGISMDRMLQEGGKSCS